MPTPHPFVGSDFTAEEFTAIGSILSAAGGVALDRYNVACMKRRIAQRIRDLQLTGAAPYLSLLRTDADEVQRLSALLSLHVSMFYRDPTTYDALRPILADQSRSRPQRWWSAGCAGGEEAYTLALLAAGIPELGSQVEIVASDVSSEILAKARGGIFNATHLSKVPAVEEERYFRPAGRGYQLNEELRKRVQFFQHDLLGDAPYPAADLILCRYVLIYFNTAEQEEVLTRFAAALPVGGLLVLGRTEILRDRAGLFASLHAQERIYQRI
ncbi:MAG: protein-glutamate O-methyltransferase CheR [Desulfuromonadales bacterium]|nr:protein-glutamate O-methyltransferase CheR [Desulfuromonadales bacterium]